MCIDIILAALAPPPRARCTVHALGSYVVPSRGGAGGADTLSTMPGRRQLRQCISVLNLWVYRVTRIYPVDRGRDMLTSLVSRLCTEPVGVQCYTYTLWIGGRDMLTSLVSHLCISVLNLWVYSVTRIPRGSGEETC